MVAGNGKASLQGIADAWVQRLTKSVADERTRLAELRVQRLPHPRANYEELPEFVKLNSSGRKHMERFERALKHLTTKGNVRLGHLQIKLLDNARVAMVKRLFGNTLVENLDWLQTKFNIRDVFESVVIIFPRRSGKTTVETIAGSTMLVSQYDANQVVFNITGRQARSWLRQARRYMDLFQSSSEFTFSVVNENMNEFVIIYANATGTTNALHSYPGGQGKDFKNLRGEGARLFMCWIDEGYWIATEGVPVIIPLLANGAGLVITSSVGAGGSRAGLMAILDARYPDGRREVKLVNYTNPCELCLAAGRADDCQHRKQKPQFFQTSGNQERVKTMMQVFEGGLYEREMENKQDKLNTSPVWDLKLIQRFADPTHDITSVTAHNYVFVGLDPHGGGDSQCTAVSGVIMRPPGARDELYAVPPSSSTCGSSRSMPYCHRRAA